ncbi:hypothetical protein [Marinobacter nauticus]|uniref:hypothetical protein n=1 Tax=Marinobacter nauticus TaxID=2743 RepID=UPI001CD3D0F6|nr:hypothetical protein [Marinobacter nauticus]MCA0912487.1 hypothetical protein [Marinobacter nauticus]
MRKLIKIIAVSALVIAIGFAALIGYDQYSRFKYDQKLLTYNSSHEWEWHDKYDRVQIRYIPEAARSVLRKVNLQDEYVIYAYKNDDYSLSAMVAFKVDCQPGNEIVTSQQYADGEPKKLVCSEDGDSLRYSVKWSGEDTDFTWEENLDGFRVRENFSNWNFDKLDQEVTLSKAK